MNQICLFLLTAMISLNSQAGPCAEAYNEAVGKNDIFQFDDDGKVTILKPKEIINNEKRKDSHKITIQAGGRRVLYVVNYADGELSSIRVDLRKPILFKGECQAEADRNELARGKVEAEQENRKNAQ